MKKAWLSKQTGSVIYGIGALCAVAGVVLNFAGRLGLGSELIGLGLVLVIGTALELAWIFA